jgi:hypothetical protein
VAARSSSTNELKELKAGAKAAKRTGVDGVLLLQATADFLNISPKIWEWPSDLPRPFSLTRTQLQLLNLLDFDMILMRLDKEGNQKPELS